MYSVHTHCSQGISLRCRVHKVVPWLGTLALIGLVATGCGGDAAPAAQSTAVPEAAEEPAIGAIGAVQQGDGGEVSIDAIHTSDASGMVDMDPSTTEIDTEPLEPRQEFLVLDVTITNIGAAPHEYNALSWSAEDIAKGDRCQAALLALTGHDLVAGDLAPKETTSGEAVLAIPADAAQLRVTYETQLFDQGTELSWNVTVP